MKPSKPAQTSVPVLDVIRDRWSPRAFDPARPVSRDVLLSVLEAGRWAASSFNDQSWSYIVATRDDATEFGRLHGCLSPRNQQWVKNVPVLMVSVVRDLFAHNGTPNRVAEHDVGQAAAQMALQATAHGLHVHQMAGVDLDKVRETYGVPDTHRPLAAFAMGYQGDVEDLDAAFHDSEKELRTRLPLSDYVFTGAFGKAAPFLS